MDTLRETRDYTNVWFAWCMTNRKNYIPQKPVPTSPLLCSARFKCSLTTLPLSKWAAVLG